MFEQQKHLLETMGTKDCCRAKPPCRAPALSEWLATGRGRARLPESDLNGLGNGGALFKFCL